MRHGLDFVDLQNPQLCRPPVRLEQRIMISTEMSGYALPMNGGVKHPADVGARDGAAMHADADEATGELVHDHEHAVAPEHDGEGCINCVWLKPLASQLPSATVVAFRWQHLHLGILTDRAEDHRRALHRRR